MHGIGEFWNVDFFHPLSEIFFFLSMMKINQELSPLADAVYNMSPDAKKMFLLAREESSYDKIKTEMKVAHAWKDFNK